jgi:hypothetical protein
MAPIRLSPTAPGGGEVRRLPPSRPMYEPQSKYPPIEGSCDWREMARRDLYRRILNIHGEIGKKLLALEQPALYRTIKYVLRAYFKGPELVATFRMGHEGHFKQLVEAAWQATPKVRAGVFYLPDIDSSGQVLFSMGTNPFSARIESYGIDPAALRSRTWYKAVAALPLGSREDRLGAVVIAWRSAQPLDPLLHFQFLASIGIDLTRVFTQKPHLLINSC